MNATVKEKRPELVNCKGVIFHDDNATPHTSLATRQKLLRLGWEVMLHPPYSVKYSVESLSYQKGGKKSLNKMENISLIKVHFLYSKKCV